MSVRQFARAAAVAIAVFAAGTALAIDVQREFSDPVLQARYEAITKELRCLVCQNETIADSNATLAIDLRREVHQMIADGKSDDEIKDFMLARYGDFVLYKPRLTGKNLLLWAAPAVFLLIGLAGGFMVIRRRAAEADVEPDSDSAGPEAGNS